MTVSSTTTKNSYSGDGSTTVFSYTFKIFDEDDIAVILRDDTTGTETTQTITTHYSVSGVGNTGGGNITFVTAPASGKTVVLLRATPLTQLTDYTPNDPFPAEAHEDALDKLTFLTQQIQEELDRSIKISRTNTMTSTEFTVGASDRASKILAFDGNGEISVTQELGTYQGNWATATDYYARDIIKDTSNNNIYICNTAHTSSGSQPISSNTDSAKWDLLVDAASATTSASAAASSATAAAASATAAAASATAAAADAVSTAADVVTTGNNVTAAQAAQAAAEAAADNFDDTYLGAKASDPTVDNDGDPLNAGDLYFNTSSNVLKVYNGSAWQVAAVSTAGLLAAANDLSDLNDAATALTNLGLTATAAELNYNDITTLGTVEASKTVTADANAEIIIPDDKKLYFGTDQDAHIRYDEATTDTLIVDGTKVKFGKAVNGNSFSSSISGSTTLDFATYQNFIVTLTGNVTLANPTTETLGQSGFIIFIQDSTGGYTVSLGTDYETAGAAGLTLSTAADAYDVVPYIVKANGSILLGTPQLAFA